MKPVLALSPALVLAGAILAAPASAQTMTPPYANPPAVQPYAPQPTTPAYPGSAAPQPYTGQPQAPGAAAQGSTGQTTSASAALPQGPYLNECKDARMLQDTLTAFCPKGDGTWHTTQLMQAERCTAGVQNAGGDLVCGVPPQVGSTAPPETYGSSYGGTYPAAPAAPSYPPTYPAAPGAQSYAAPSPYATYGAPYNTYGVPPANPPAPPRRPRLSDRTAIDGLVCGKTK